MKRKWLWLAALAVAMLLVILAANAAYEQRSGLRLQQNIDRRMREVTEPNMITFDLQIGEQVKKVNTMADFFGKVGTVGDELQQELILSAVEQNGLLRCAITMPDGTFITHDGKVGSSREEPFYIAALRGEFTISDPRPAVVDPTKTVILFTAPIYKGGIEAKEGGEVVGALTYSYLCADMEKIFNLRFLNEQGQMFVVKKSGELLIGQTDHVKVQENLLDYLRANCTHQDHPPENCLQLGGERASMVVTYADQQGRQLVNIDRLPYNDWYMLSIVPESAGFDIYRQITQEQRKVGMLVGACAFIYAMVLLAVATRGWRHTDRMTGLSTLESFKLHAKRRLHAYPDKRFVCIKLDIKNFKLINRIYDFAVGDQVIKNVAAALQVTLAGVNALSARTGTDDFLLMIEYDSRLRLDELREQFIRNFRALMGAEFTTTVEFPTGQYVTNRQDAIKPDITEILEKVNFAHRAAKQRDWGIIVDYEENLEKVAIFQKAIEDKMSSALTNEEFQLYLQPKYNVQTERICGAEALVRWTVNGQHFLHPTAFVPVLERNGFIVKIDMFMFRRAVEKVREIIDSGCEPIVISVNFSRCHLTNEHFVQELCLITDECNVPHHLLEIELTESVVFDNLGRIIELTNQLHEAGFGLSMDDFGSGYSCLGLLKNIEVDVIKIDKCFFDDNCDTDRARIVIANVLRMAQELQIKTVAEGVEVREQVEMLRELGCDMIQGYYYAKPMPAEELDLRRTQDEEHSVLR